MKKKAKITKIKNNKINNENKKIGKMKKYYSEKTPTKISWPMSAKSDKNIFLFKKKKKTKLPWPISAKSEA